MPPRAWASDAPAGELRALAGLVWGRWGPDWRPERAGLTQGHPPGDKGARWGSLGTGPVLGGQLGAWAAGSHFSGDWGLTGQVQASKKLSRLMSAKPLDCP